MKSHRAEFSDKVKSQAWERCAGNCEHCGNPIRAGNGPEYHHDIDAMLGGPNTLENCLVLCIRPCHKAVTAERRPEITKTKRLLEKRIGLRKSKRPFPQRADPWGKDRW